MSKGNQEKGNIKGREDEHRVTQVVTRNVANKHAVRTRQGWQREAFWSKRGRNVEVAEIIFRH